MLGSREVRRGIHSGCDGRGWLDNCCPMSTEKTQWVSVRASMPTDLDAMVARTARASDRSKNSVLVRCVRIAIPALLAGAESEREAAREMARGQLSENHRNSPTISQNSPGVLLRPHERHAAASPASADSAQKGRAPAGKTSGALSARRAKARAGRAQGRRSPA